MGKTDKPLALKRMTCNEIKIKTKAVNNMIETNGIVTDILFHPLIKKNVSKGSLCNIHQTFAGD